MVVSVSRLVPRKGMDVLIDAAAALVPSFPDLTVAIAGTAATGPGSRPGSRASGAPVRLLGGSPDDDLPRLYGAADVFVMACRDRWLGLEQEGFGIVFLEAAACGVAQVAGRSGGADEAVLDGQTGLVVDDPANPARWPAALRRLLADDELRRRMGRAARRRAGRASVGTSSHIGWPAHCRTWKADRRPPRPRPGSGTPTGAAPGDEQTRATKECCGGTGHRANGRRRPAGAVLRRGERHRAVPGVGGRHQAGRGRAARRRGSARPRRPSGPGPSAGPRATPWPTTTPAPRTLAWKQTAGDLTSKLDGSYSFDAAGDGSTEVTYTLEVELRVPLPGLHQAPGPEPDHAHRAGGAQGARRILADDVSAGPAPDRRRPAQEVGVAGQVTIGIDVGGTKVLGLAVDDEAWCWATCWSRARGAPPRRCRATAAGRTTRRRPVADVVIEVLAAVTEQLLRQHRRRRCRRWAWGCPASSTTPGCCASPPTCRGGTGLDIAGGLSRPPRGHAHRRRQRRHVRHGGGVGLRRRRRAPPTPWW